MDNQRQIFGFEQWRDQQHDFHTQELTAIDPYHPALFREYAERVKMIDRISQELEAQPGEVTL